MSKTRCIVCHSRLTELYYNPKNQPLAALALPKTKEDALLAPRYEMEFVACLSCGHIFNRAFDYYHVPYDEDSNLMYNSGSGWREHLREVATALNSVGLKSKTVIDIGCGDGGFLEILKEIEPDARYVGFEPGIEAANAQKKGLEIHKDYFLANRDIAKYRPDILVCRHVVEHLSEPRDFVEEISFFAEKEGVRLHFLVEVPNIQNAINDARVADYLYEHISNFSPSSLRKLFEVSGFEAVDAKKMYKDEVLVFVAKSINGGRVETKKRLNEKSKELLDQKERLDEALKRLQDEGKRVAIWGATGKGASFINSFELDCERCPVVVDSDGEKVELNLPLAYEAYMQKLNSATICLDSYPFGGFNTIMDALHLGKPVVTWEGTKAYNRLASAVLRRLGLNELIATSKEEYVSIATRLLTDKEFYSRVCEHIKALDIDSMLFTRNDELDDFVEKIGMIIDGKITKKR